MSTFRFALAFVGVLLISACGSSATPTPVAGSSASPTSATTLGSAVLVGHSDNPSTVTLMRLDGTVVTFVPGVGVGDEHAVGAYLVVASDSSGKGWTVDASGVVRDVAPAAVAILSPSINGGWTPPLIVDSTTAVIVRCTNDTCTANKVELSTGAVRPLLTVPQSRTIALSPPLTVLDVTPDRTTVWLGKLSAGGTSGQLEIVGIDLLTGTISSLGQVNALAGAEIAITRDGKSVAGQEVFGTDSTNLLIRHLHIVSLGTKVDSDMQGTAPYVGGQRSPSVLFAPGGASVAWWGGLNNGDTSFVVNVAALEGAGRTLYAPPNTNSMITLSGVFWVDPATLVVQNGSQTLTINAATGAQTLVSWKLGYLDSVLS